MERSGKWFASRARQEEERTVGVAPGWQHEATDAVLIHLLETSVRPRLTLAEQALLRSQGGPMSGVPFTSVPTSAISRFESSVFRVLLQRRLWLPLPPSTRKCRCGRLLDVRGHHRAACAVVGVLGEAWFPSAVSSCKSLPRGRGASVHQCHGEGPRHPPVGPTGWPETGGGG